MNKRIIMLLLALTVLLGAFTLTASAAEPEILASGDCGENLTWTLDSEGTLTISGSGPMVEFPNWKAPWDSYNASIHNVKMEDGITSICDDAFRGCTNLTSVIISSDVTSIGNRAFSRCTSLICVTIPNRVVSIGDDAFSYCTSLTSITIPDSVISIGEYAFRDCTSLVDVTIPDSVTSIGEYAFGSCRNLTSVTIPDSVVSIGEYAFFDCTSLTSITIPDSVASIGIEVFLGCSNLEGIWVDNGNPNYSSDDRGVLFDKNKSLLIRAPGAIDGHYSVPDSVISIGDKAFLTCDKLTSVRIPDGVTSIGDNAFHYCSRLTSVTIPDSVTSIGDAVFCWCDSLTSVTIPDSVTSIGNSMFSECNSLTSVTIPNSVTSIGGSAFNNCTSLTSVTIPNSVTSIGSSAFSWCTSLTDIYYEGTEEQWGQISIESKNECLTNANIHFNSILPDNPVTPPVEDDKPVTPPTEDNKPITPPVEDDKPVTPPVVDDKPIENPFADVPAEQYYFEPVLWAVDNGITTGVSETAFAPDDTCTRAQIVTFLWRANGSPSPESDSNPFTDVPAGQWYTDAVLWAVENGITSGTSATTFSPDAGCTRGQVATFLHRSQGKPAPGGENIFSDLISGAYYYDAVLWAVENGITNGMGDGTFAPDATCTRGQIVTFLYRAMN